MRGVNKFGAGGRYNAIEPKFADGNWWKATRERLFERCSIVIDFLFLRTWWTYASGRYPAQAIPYHWFNLFEGTAWLVFAGLVSYRYARHRNGAI